MNHCLKWGTHFDLANKRDRVEELEHTMEEPGFWDDPNKSAAVVQDCKKLKTTIERYEKLCNDKDDTLTIGTCCFFQFPLKCRNVFGYVLYRHLRTVQYFN